MKNISYARKSSATVGTLFALFFVLSFGFGSNQAHAAITRNLSVGSTGSEVTELQQFLATNPDIYPQGIVSGYFGSLTRAAVIQFQGANDIDRVGNVGPITRARINAIMNSGFGLDTHAPGMSVPVVNTGTNGATISWTTNEPAQGQVYYDTQFIQSNEATAHFQQPYISGTLAANVNPQSSQAITIPNLQRATSYYYVVRSIDRSGNVTMTLPKSFFTGN